MDTQNTTGDQAVPVSTAECGVCAHLEEQRQGAFRVYDWSRATDYQVLTRRHMREAHEEDC
ncbi:hypothetical protein AB0J21_26015 [Streptomyces sp. NPDC049954]|uniref:hypothetical protein n=1 Tax=Streptomyces sp. NPDC049954 TaxID=3155779 RepID=UPI00341B913F